MADDGERAPKRARPTLEEAGPNNGVAAGANSSNSKPVPITVKPINFVGMQNGLRQVKPGHLWKNRGATGWGSTAISAEYVQCDSSEINRSSLWFSPRYNDKDLLVGLGSQSTVPTDYRDIDFAVCCYSDGNLYMVLNGEWELQGSYEAFCLIELRIESGRVELYLDDKKMDYSGSLPGPTILFAMADFGHVDGEAESIEWSGLAAKSGDPAGANSSNYKPVLITVNGLSGPRCTVKAFLEWTVRQVQQVVCEKISVPVNWQKLIKGGETLTLEATVGSLLPEEAASSLQLMLVVTANPINFRTDARMDLEQLEPGHLRKTRGVTEWGSTAISAKCIQCGPLEPKLSGFCFRPGQRDKDLVIGLGSRTTPPHDYRDIDFGVSCWSDGYLYMVQRGEWRRRGSYKANSLIELRIENGRVDLYLNNNTSETMRYDESLPGPTTLYAMADFGHVGAEAVDIQWL